ncbi:phenylacetate--CoA ligase family protein [Serratia sp. PAMC26656]|uniref:phenylacetate--CoA ligase family protein n=1 Tax=Serratia sp. PAMC26656 TaxID=2775909 RepID=UPI0018F593C3|nr:phenylacetate--CoA ligase family protein [Serratia sp. PAMC26656]MBJ7892276.1 phenylacetate--CoA ligase family protein [Serratia sp. PAMC26656]
MIDSGNFEDVKREIEYAYQHARFFRNHIDESGIVPDAIDSVQAFKRLPVTRKMHYRKNYPFGVLAAGYTLNSPHVMRFQSSGTSGERLNSAIFSFDLARRQATSLSVNEKFNSLWLPGKKLKLCRYAPPNCSDVECGIGLSTMEERTLADGTLVLSVAHDLLATPLRMINQALDEIALYNPDILVVDPTHLAFLTRQAAKLGRTISSSNKLHIICGYTQLTHVARRQITQFFGDDVPVGNMLGMSELGYLGFECHHGSLHLNNQDYFVELLANGEDVQENQPGELVISTIDDGLIPRIRYATGDLYRFVAGSCTCGSTLPRVVIEGRATQNLLVGNRSISPTDLDAAVGDAPGIDLYKMEQNQAGKLTFRFIANEQFNALTLARIKDVVGTLIGTDDIEYLSVDYIPCERSGKFQSCISQFHEVKP